MKHACLFAVLVLAMILHAGASAQEQTKTLRVAVPDIMVWEQAFPIPQGARRNHALGGATTLATGRNYRMTVYEIDASVEAMSAFYASHLANAKRESESQEVRFVTAGGYVKLARLAEGCRITLVVGPN